MGNDGLGAIVSSFGLQEGLNQRSPGIHLNTEDNGTSLKCTFPFRHYGNVAISTECIAYSLRGIVSGVINFSVLFS